MNNQFIIQEGLYPFLHNKQNLRSNMMVFHRYIVSPTYIGNLDMGMRYRVNLNLNYQFPKNFILEVLPYRSFGISFSYKFGKMDFKKEKDISNEYLNGPGSGS